jgi:hypothetical protein
MLVRVDVTEDYPVVTVEPVGDQDVPDALVEAHERAREAWRAAQVAIVEHLRSTDQVGNRGLLYYVEGEFF